MIPDTDGDRCLDCNDLNHVDGHDTDGGGDGDRGMDCDVVNYDEGGENHDACKVEQERAEAQQQAEDKQTEVEVDEMK